MQNPLFENHSVSFSKLDVIQRNQFSSHFTRINRPRPVRPWFNCTSSLYTRVLGAAGEFSPTNKSTAQKPQRNDASPLAGQAGSDPVVMTPTQYSTGSGKHFPGHRLEGEFLLVNLFAVCRRLSGEPQSTWQKCPSDQATHTHTHTRERGKGSWFVLTATRPLYREGLTLHSPDLWSRKKKNLYQETAQPELSLVDWLWLWQKWQWEYME